MRHFPKNRLFHEAIRDRGNHIEDVVDVRIGNLTRTAITLVRAWGEAYPSDAPFAYTVHFQRDEGFDPTLYELVLSTCDANAAFEAKLRFA